MVKRKIVVGITSTVLPRKCGIATHSYNLMINLTGVDRYSGSRWTALVKGKQNFKEDIDIWRKLNQKKPNIKALLAAIVKDRNNLYQTGLFERVEIIPFEYGIWEDKNDRDFLIQFIKGLHDNGITNITIPHTTLRNPKGYNDPSYLLNTKKGDQYEEVMMGILKYTDQVICMTPTAIDILEDTYNAPRELLTHIDHGINKLDIPYNRQELKSELGLFAKNNLVTGGLFSRGKDVPTVLKSVANIKNSLDKDITYIMIGVTHPDTLKKEGEAYRKECFNLAKKLGLNPIMMGNGEKDNKGLRQLKEYDLKGHNVIFLNSFLNDTESLESKVLATATIIPNNGRSQISSGEIARAIEADRTYLSTETPYSKDMAKQGIGFTYKHEDVADLTKNMSFLLRGRQKGGANLYEMEMASAVKKAKMYWKDKSREIFQILEAIVDKKEDMKIERIALR